MTTTLLSMMLLGASCACAERIVRGPRVAAAGVWATMVIATWIALAWMRVPPGPARALLLIASADAAIVTLAVLAVLRLLGAFVEPPTRHDADDDDESPSPTQPSPPDPTPSVRVPTARPHSRRPRTAHARRPRRTSRDVSRPGRSAR